MYSNVEYTDMLLTLGECLGNSSAAVTRYSEKFPRRNLPSKNTFRAVERRCRETGNVNPKKINSGRPRTTRNVNKEIIILNLVDQDPTVSVRNMARQTNTSSSSTWRILKEQQLHPYHYRQVQELLPDDLPIRVDFCQTLQERTALSPNFLKCILFTDEATFTRQGMFNSHNAHYWCDENPQVKRVSHYQHSFKVNVWAATLGNKLIGYHILPGNLNGDMYLDFLNNHLFEILEDLTLNERRSLFFMHDGAPPHFDRRCRNWLSNHYPNRWIGRGAEAPIHWPPRSCDLNPLDYTVWSYLKEKVYATEVNSRQELENRIQRHFNDLIADPQPFRRLMDSLEKRIHLCIRENGGHFEHLL